MMASKKVCKYRYSAEAKRANGKLKKTKAAQRYIKYVRATRSCRTGRKLKNVSKKLQRKLRESLKKLRASAKPKRRGTKKTRKSKRRTCKYPKTRRYYRKDGTLRKSKRARSIRRKWRSKHSCRTGKRYKRVPSKKRGKKSKKSKKSKALKGLKFGALTSADRKWWQSTLTDCTKEQKKKGCTSKAACLWDDQYNFCYDKDRDIAPFQGPFNNPIAEGPASTFELGEEGDAFSAPMWGGRRHHYRW